MSSFYGHDECEVLNNRIEAQLEQEAAALCAVVAEEPPPSVVDLLHTWLDNLPHGLALRDLPDAVYYLQELQKFITTNEPGVHQIFLRFLEIMQKPLIELKSNERLTAQGKQVIEDYFSNIFQLLPMCNAQYLTYLAHTLRCMIHAGEDPTALKGTKSSNQSEDDGLARIVDLDYIMGRIFSSGGLTYLATAFNHLATSFQYTEADSTDGPKSKQNIKQMTKEEELAFYGLPVNLPSPTNEESVKPDPHFDPFLTSTSNKDIVSIDLRPLHDESIVALREVSQTLLDLSLDLSAAPDCSAMMCEVGMSRGILTMLKKDFDHDKKDTRLPYWLELLWYLLETYLEQMRRDRGEGDNRKYYLMKHEVILDVSQGISILKVYLLYLLEEGYKLYDKECRNEVVILLTLLADFPKSVGHFLSANMLDILITYACVEEMGHSTWPFFLKSIAQRRNFSSLQDVDSDFKKQVWTLLSILFRSNDPDALLCLAASPFLSCLLTYLEQEPPQGETSGGSHTGSPTQNNNNTNNNHTSSIMKGSVLENKTLQSASFHPWDDNNMSKSLIDQGGAGAGGVGGTMWGSRFKPKTSTWQVSTKASSIDMLGVKKGFISTLTPNKLKEFQSLASLFLVHHAPKILGEFERVDGPKRVLHLALRYCKAESSELKSIVLNSLLLLYRCLVNSLTVRTSLEDSQVISSLLYLFVYCTEEEARAQAVRLISSLCSQNNLFCQNEVVQQQGLQLLLLPLREYVTKRPPIVGLKAGIKVTLHEGSDPLPDPLDNPMAGEVSVLVIAVLDCLKESVVGNGKSELVLADIEGLDALLDLLEISPFILRLQVMRLLSDLLLNAKLTPYVNVWRSAKTLRSAAQLLCHAWMDEESRLQSERKDSGVVCDLFHPLQNQQWPLEEKEKNIILLSRSVAGDKNMFTQSVTVNKLATAILAGRNAMQTNLPLDICQKALECDQRVVSSHLLGLLGLFELYDIQPADNPFKDIMYSDSPTQSPGRSTISSPGKNLQTTGGRAGGMNTDTMLSPKERQVLVMARKFFALREGEWWLAVQSHINHVHTVPIEADINLMNSRLEVAFDAAVAVQTEQMALVEMDFVTKKEGEDQYIDQILTKKHQQIKAEWLKRRTKTAGKKPTQVKK